jgi:aminomethyltransferase
MTEFGGFEMPLSYTGIIEEHQAVRRMAGIFDLSHMGEFELRGSGALPLLEHVFTNSAHILRDGQAQYTLMCNESGGTLDDVIAYRLEPDRYMLCVNAANIAPNHEWLLRRGGSGGAELLDLSDEIGLIAIQGPRAEAILSKLSRLSLRDIRRFHATTGDVAGVSSLVARTGYTGEDGFEIFVAAQSASRIFESLLDAGVPDGLKPCGLGARDTLRMEASLPLYGHELDQGISPVEAGLVRFVKFGHAFIGESVLAAQQDGGLKRHLIGFQTDDGKSIARQGYKVFKDSRQAGVVTSGTFAPALARPVAMALVETAAGLQQGARIMVEIRNRMAPASVVPLPFYRRT